MKFINDDVARVAAAQKFSDGHLDVYLKDEQPVAVVLWRGSAPEPLMLLKDLGEGCLAKCALVSEGDIPPHDERKTYLHREIEVQEHEGRIKCVRARQNDEPFMAVACNGFPNQAHDFNRRERGIFCDGYIDRDGLPVGDVTAYFLRAMTCGAQARDWPKERLAAFVSQVSSDQIADVLEERATLAPPRELLYGVCPDGLYFAALYDAGGIPVYKETGITLDRIRLMLGEPMAELIARDRGELAEDMMPNYRRTVFVGLTHVERERLVASEQQRFDIRRVSDGRIDSTYPSKGRAKSALDEADRDQPLGFYGIDLATGVRFVSFNGNTELMKQGRTEQQFFEEMDADAAQRRSRRMSCGM